MHVVSVKAKHERLTDRHMMDKVIIMWCFASLVQQKENLSRGYIEDRESCTQVKTC